MKGEVSLDNANGYYHQARSLIISDNAYLFMYNQAKAVGIEDLEDIWSKPIQP
jgi:hypothetical protein